MDAYRVVVDAHLTAMRRKAERSTHVGGSEQDRAKDVLELLGILDRASARAEKAELRISTALAAIRESDHQCATLDAVAAILNGDEK